MPIKPSIILGITHGHGDSSAALVVNGSLVAAAEEERFTRVKHYALFPHKAIAYCLEHAKLKPEDVQVVAVPREPRAHFGKKLKMFWQYPHLFQGRRGHRTAPEDHESLHKQLKVAGLKKSIKFAYFNLVSRTHPRDFRIPPKPCGRSRAGVVPARGG